MQIYSSPGTTGKGSTHKYNLLSHPPFFFLSFYTSRKEKIYYYPDLNLRNPVFCFLAFLATTLAVHSSDTAPVFKTSLRIYENGLLLLVTLAILYFPSVDR